jgi:hypothetical protein
MIENMTPSESRSGREAFDPEPVARGSRNDVPTARFSPSKSRKQLLL